MKKSEIESNWPLVGNRQITDFLDKSIANNSVSHTYIFNGPDNLGKTTAAKYFAKILLCKNSKDTGIPCDDCESCQRINIGKTNFQDDLSSLHGDFHIVKKEKDKKNISVGQVREFIHSLNMSSFADGYKVGIIKHADSLSVEAANALLKTLEEPKKDVVIILITQMADLLPQTIVSRSQVLNFYLVDKDIIYDFLVADLKASRSQAKNYSRVCLGRPALAVRFFEDNEFREEYEKRVDVFIGFMREDISFRLQEIDNLIDKKMQGQVLTSAVKRILEVWQGVARDCFLFENNNIDLIQHYQVEEFVKNNNSLRNRNVIKLLKMCKKGERLLQANVNPKLILENIAINI